MRPADFYLAIVTKILKKSTIYWMDWVRDGIWGGDRRHINRLIRESKDIGLEFSRNHKLTSFVQLKLYRGETVDFAHICHRKNQNPGVRQKISGK